MRRVAIFTEGLSELIFVRNFLMKVIDNAKLSFNCLTLSGENLLNTPYRYGSSKAKVHFLIINTQNDSRVVSAIKERGDSLFRNGFERIIGLRDLYCEAYDKRSAGKINAEVSKEIMEGINAQIEAMSNPDAIAIYFSIMELEAWFLAMYNIFGKMHPKLKVSYIEKKLRFNLMFIDPQKEFYKPANIIIKIWSLCGMKYKKSADDIEMMTSVMERADFETATRDGRCESFDRFHKVLLTYNS